MFTVLGLSGLADAKAPLEYVDGLYLGAGLQYLSSKSYDERSVDIPLTFDIRYAPAWSSSVRPYGRFVVTSMSRPTDAFKLALEDFSPRNTENEADSLSWRRNDLNFQLGVELDLPAELFLRTGMVGHHSDWSGATEQLVDTFHVSLDWTTETRGGLFAAVGKRFDLDAMLLESSFGLAHYRGLTVGGKDTTVDLCGTLEDENTDFCDRSRSDFASSRTVFGVNNHMNVGPVAMAADLFYGLDHSSKYQTDLAEEYGDTSRLNPTFYGVHLTVGYEFGQGKPSEGAAKSGKSKKPVVAGIQMTGIAEFDELFMKAKAIQDRVVALRMKLAEGRAAFAASVGATAGMDLSAVLADQAKGSVMSAVSVSMAGGVPSFSVKADAPPEAQQAAAGLTSLANTAKEATQEMVKLKDDVMQLINDAQAFPGKAPAAAQEALKSGSLKFMDIPKVPKKVVGNIKEMAALPGEIGGLAKDAASTAAVLGSLAGG